MSKTVDPSSTLDPKTASSTKNKPGKRPTICVAMIVKNEEEHIIHTLENVRQVCSCWCVLDTGSTDNTLQLLAEYNVKNQATYPGYVFEGPFEDFSQARNLLLDHAQPLADWLLLIDADWELIGIEKLFTEINDDIDCLSMALEDAKGFWFNRLIRSGMPWRFKNRVHEVLEIPDKKRSAYSKVLIRHKGADRISPEKYEWYASLQLKDVEEFPNNGYYPYRLADTYTLLEEYKKAIKYYRKALRLYGDNEEGEFYYYVLYRLGECMKQLGYPGEAKAMLLRAARLRVHRREALLELMRVLADEKDYPQICGLGREFTQYVDVNVLNAETDKPLDDWMVDTTAWACCQVEWALAEAMLGNVQKVQEICAGLQAETIPADYEAKYVALLDFIHATKDI